MVCGKRLQGAKLNKAKKGELRCAPPTGYVYDPEGKLMKDPDESVVTAIDLVFQQFQLLGTAFKVMRYESPTPNSLPQKGLGTRDNRHSQMGSSQPQPNLSHLTQPHLYWHLCLWQTAFTASHPIGTSHPRQNPTTATIRVDCDDS
jgi:hypothetical protein